MSQHNAALAGEWRVGGFEPAGILRGSLLFPRKIERFLEHLLK
jgi:hypothetical protein